MINNKLRDKSPNVLVENKVSFAAENTELSIYDTYQEAYRVKLSSDQIMFCGMVQGKKVMHANRDDIHQDFFPHETFVMAPNQEVEIDFPEANMAIPTTCLAIEISSDRVQKVADNLNLSSPIDPIFEEWHYRPQVLHTHHTAETQALLNRMVRIYTENHTDREFLIDLAVTELSARLLRQQARDTIVSFCRKDPEHNSLIAAVSYIQNHIDEPVDIEALCKIACMGRSKFFNAFKRHLGFTPVEFQQQQRIKKAAELIQGGKTITEVCFQLGFSSTSHFSRVFKRFLGMPPSLFQIRHCKASTN